MNQNYRERLNGIVAKAYEESPFYRQQLLQRGGEIEECLSAWHKVPIAKKADMVCTRESVIPPKYYIGKSQKKIITETTSGSTGQCLQIYWDKKEYVNSMLSLWIRRKAYYGISPSDRYCYFYTLHNPDGREPKEQQRGYGLGFSKMNLTEERIAQIYERILEYQPIWMVLQPGIAILLSRYIFETGAEPVDALRYIELTGEMYTPQNKKFIENAFECRVAGQYGTYEVNSIAYECPEGHMHILDDNVYVEVCREGSIVPEGEEGTILVTSLHNTIMPFIRYEVGDWGRIRNCTCPWCDTKVLELTRGRSNDLIRCDDGRNISVYEFVKIFGSICEQIDGRILQYQIEQKDYRLFWVNIVAEDEPEEIEALFYHYIENPYLQQCEYKFFHHKRLLPEENTGKLRMFRGME